VVRNREPVEPQRLDADGVVVLLAPRKFFAECERAVLELPAQTGTLTANFIRIYTGSRYLMPPIAANRTSRCQGVPRRSYLVDQLCGSHMGDDSTVTADDIAQYAKRARFDPNRFDPDEQTAAIDAQDELMTPLEDLDVSTARLIGSTGIRRKGTTRTVRFSPGVTSDEPTRACCPDSRSQSRTTLPSPGSR